MNSKQYPSTSTNAATPALMRAVGLLAGTLRQTRLRPPQDRDLAAIKETCEGLVGSVLQAVAGRDLDTGPDAAIDVVRNPDKLIGVPDPAGEAPPPRAGEGPPPVSSPGASPSRGAT